MARTNLLKFETLRSLSIWPHGGFVYSCRLGVPPEAQARRVSRQWPLFSAGFLADPGRIIDWSSLSRHSKNQTRLGVDR
ncbi:hypothetical protein BV22DRAFT_824607 [Leucogyrophana mollusca]|uniref:Uncharacterized protein n=1 Tax=Leucogyrophana mollusca TaxID=85980 RepID=A0ACB8B4F9_9AGAM|nr:hypothetical protein BV22DRAFT_824607 [Leucogyrophana mollusca]